MSDYVESNPNLGEIIFDSVNNVLVQPVFGLIKEVLMLSVLPIVFILLVTFLFKKVLGLSKKSKPKLRRNYHRR
jgi:hypothetical protein